MDQPLKDKRIVITRPEKQASMLRQRLEALGAYVITLPLIEVNLSYDENTWLDVCQEMASYEWAVFTSVNGVDRFFELFFKRFEDIRCLGPMRLACVGPATASELKRWHLQPDLVPQEATASALADALIATGSLDNTKILVVTGNLNRVDLVRRLEQEGQAIVDTLCVYETKEHLVADAPAALDFMQKGADAILFASPSAVHSFRSQVRDLMPGDSTNRRQPVPVSIGPCTTEALIELGLAQYIQAVVHTEEGMVDILIDKMGSS